MTDVKHCQEPVPEALTGGQSGLSCKLVAKSNGRPHDGQHKAHWSLPKLGKVTIMWKVRNRSTPPPEIELPAVGSETLHARRSFR
jgi:hypothetical protein